ETLRLPRSRCWSHTHEPRASGEAPIGRPPSSSRLSLAPPRDSATRRLARRGRQAVLAPWAPIRARAQTPFEPPPIDLVARAACRARCERTTNSENELRAA